MYLQWFAREPTEPATPRRLEQARERGQVFKSTEVIATATLLGAYLALLMGGPRMWQALTRFAAEEWSRLVRPDLTPAGAQELAIRVMLVTGTVLAPLMLAVVVAGLLANYMQVGFLFSLNPVTPDFKRLNPLEGLKRLFSRRALADLAKALAKVTVIGVIVYQTVRAQLREFPALMDLPAPALLSRVGSLVSTVILRVVLAMTVIAVLDYLFQRYEYLQSLRMTKQEVKEELKETEGSPEVRARIRRRQRELARRRMMAEVKKADVVVTNPTHFAVALKYTQGEMDAPRVVAKGAGYLALKIRQLAEEAGVAVVQNPPLARSLYDGVELDAAIPPELYQAVAEVLAFVFRSRPGR